MPAADGQTGRDSTRPPPAPVRNCAAGHNSVRWLATFLAAVLASAAQACTNGRPFIVLATTTSVANSGLLDHLLPRYEQHAGVSVRVLPVGSGRALRMLSIGEADVVISHAPQREAEALAGHPDWMYRKILFNDFLIVGPSQDPARIAGLQDVMEALRRIAANEAKFVSRADQSGTHEREQQLWTASGATPRTDRIIPTAQGMSATLRVASEMSAYTLTDRGTYLQLRDRLRLAELVSGDPRLLNTYAVIAPRAATGAAAFAGWLAEGQGREALHDLLRSKTIVGFEVWPEDKPGTHPHHTPR